MTFEDLREAVEATRGRLVPGERVIHVLVHPTAYAELVRQSPGRAGFRAMLNVDGVPILAERDLNENIIDVVTELPDDTENSDENT